MNIKGSDAWVIIIFPGKHPDNPLPNGTRAVQLSTNDGHYMETTIKQGDLKFHHDLDRLMGDDRRVPSYQEIAGLFNAENDDVRESFHQRHERQMICLGPGAATMLGQPFSGIPINFQVSSGGKEWGADCVWNSCFCQLQSSDSEALHSVLEAGSIEASLV